MRAFRIFAKERRIVSLV